MSSSALKAKLMPGERILWDGRPAQGLLFTGRDLLLIPFSIVWLGFIVFWLWNVISQGAPIFFYIWGSLFLVFGMLFLVGRFVLDAQLRSRTIYAVSDQRILILRSAPFAKFTSIDLDRLLEVNLEGDGRSRGHIRFGPSTSLIGSRSFSTWVPSLDPVPQFLGIVAPSTIFELITKASRAARRS